MCMVFFGLLLSTVGVDPMSGAERFTFDRLELMGGLELIPVMMGLFGVGEILLAVNGSASSNHFGQAGNGFEKLLPTARRLGRIQMGDAARYDGRVFVGILPGTGAAVASFVSYAVERKISKHPERFGQGAMEGLATAKLRICAVGGGDFGHVYFRDSGSRRRQPFSWLASSWQASSPARCS